MSGRWFSDPAVSGGGSFIDTGCHSLDLFHFLVGPSAVAGSVYDYDWKGRGESSATVLVKAKDGTHKGVAGVILAGWLEPERFTVDLIGTGGSLHYDYMAGEDLIFKGADSKPHTIKVTTHEVRFREQLVGWAAAARGGARGNLAGFAEGLLAAESVEAAARAARG
jgi:predicted dehydrogenase